MCWWHAWGWILVTNVKCQTNVHINKDKMPGSGDSSRKRDVLPSCDEDVLRLESLCSHHCLPDDDDDDDDDDCDGADYDYCDIWYLKHFVIITMESIIWSISRMTGTWCQPWAILLSRSPPCPSSSTSPSPAWEIEVVHHHLFALGKPSKNKRGWVADSQIRSKPPKTPQNLPENRLFWPEFHLSFSQISKKPCGGWVGHQVAQLALVRNLATRWRHLHYWEIWPPGGATCISE